MNNKALEEYNDLKIRDIIIWVYIILFFALLFAKNEEEKSIKESNTRNPSITHDLQLIVFFILILIYLYFFLKSVILVNEEENTNNIIRLISSIGFLIAGILVFYLETKDIEDEEIGI